MPKCRQLLLSSVIAVVIAVALAGGLATSASAQEPVTVCHLTAFGYTELQVAEAEVEGHLAHGDVRPDEYGACPTDEPEPGANPFVTFFRALLRIFLQFLASLFGGLFGGSNVSFSQ
jgi:CBS domain containing-hemolysin-like protein